MAKQTFTVGQVLTAAQVTSLQQTAMLGGAAQAKTASYTLVAADAGTAISMTSTSATTITVNTGLFAAGDTVFIQNLGSGNLTITAGSATVSTAGSLILPTNDAGVLYFVSTGVSIFYDFIQVGATSPLTTKGDLYGFSTLDARIPIGANATVLTADSTESLGLKWATPAAGGAYTLLSTTSLTGASTTISNISQSYTDLYVVVDYMYFTAGGSGNFSIRPNASTTLSNLAGSYGTSANAGNTDFRSSTTVSIGAANIEGNSPSNIFVLKISQYSNSNVVKALEYFGGFTASGSPKVAFHYAGYFRDETAITSLVFVGSTNFGSQYAPPQVNIYGVK